MTKRQIYLWTFGATLLLGGVGTLLLSRVLLELVDEGFSRAALVAIASAIAYPSAAVLTRPNQPPLD
jgi:hypothetical protein